MLRLLCLYSILNTQYLFYGASPLIGEAVRMANPEEFPFIVSLSHRTYGSLERVELNHFCGGSLITNKHVLTSADCHLKYPLDNIVVKIGSIDLRNARVYGIRWGLTYSQWAGNHLPEGYNAGHIYDMAIIKILGTVSDIELPTISYLPKEDLYGKSAKTGGWGLMEDNEQPRYMRIAKFIIETPERCEPLLNIEDLILKDLLLKQNLCTAAAHSASATFGDCGSPLLLDNNNIVGVNAAYCIPMNDVSVSNYRGLYSSVKAYAEFIEAGKKL